VDSALNIELSVLQRGKRVVPGNLVRIHHTMYTNTITNSYSVMNLIVTPGQQLVSPDDFSLPRKI